MSLSTTALHALHTERGARLINFAGWELPVQFSGIIAEHQHTRNRASLFDVSHMGQFLVKPRSGDLADAAAALERVMPVSVAGLSQNRQRYGLFTTDSGGVVDDLMFAHYGHAFFLVVNASRRTVDADLLGALDEITLEALTDRSLLALQGPEAAAALTSLVPAAASWRFMDSAATDWDGVEVWLSRSGYTGEDGFEISVPSEHAERLARSLLSIDGVLPAGLGARDSLRLEAGMPLYGHELSETISPVEAGLSWAIPKVRRRGGSRAGGFPGAEVILGQLDGALQRRRVGLRAEGRAPIREGTDLLLSPGTEPIATVTSGGVGPSVGGPIAMAMLPLDIEAGRTVYAHVRGKHLPLTVTNLPFITPSYKR